MRLAAARSAACAGYALTAAGEAAHQLFERVEFGGAEVGEAWRGLALDPQGALRRLLALGGQGDELAAPVGGVGAALDQAALLEVVDDEGGVRRVDADRGGQFAKRQRPLGQPQQRLDPAAAAPQVQGLAQDV